MRLMDDMSRANDKSRPNSILRGVANNMRPNSRQNPNLSLIQDGGGDDVETVKNSMINLLNVVL